MDTTWDDGAVWDVMGWGGHSSETVEEEADISDELALLDHRMKLSLTGLQIMVPQNLEGKCLLFL